MSATQAVVRGVPLEQRTVVAFGIVLACAALGLFSTWRGASALLSYGVFGATAVLSIAFAFGDSLAAGDGWLGSGKRFVRTDELIGLDARRGRGGVAIDMRDRDGRRLRTNLDQLRSDRHLWDLVRDGVAKSLAAGLVPGDDVRSAFDRRG